jgi:LmbE family N-acetylglucosaminyl deacetylase
MTKDVNRILVLAPHTDDGEFGCGGSIARFVEEGKEVYYVAFSTAKKSVPAGMPKDILGKEVKEATALLGIKQNNLIVFDYEVRTFPLCRQDILEDMVKLQRQLNPDLIFLPSSNDTHQDHNVIASEGFRAFKKSTMLGYEVPWNNLTFVTNAFIFLEKKHLDKKINALKCYISQLGRSYVNEEFIRSLAVTRGAQIGVLYAETFEVIRWVMK